MTLKPLVAATLAVALVACSDSTGPEDPPGVSLSVTAPVAGAAVSAPAGANLAVTQTDGSNELVIERVRLVLREVELKRVVTSGCTDDVAGGDDGCEEFETGPMVLEVPTDGSLAQIVSIEVPADSYDQIEFDIHKPDDDSPEDLAFLAANPDFVDASVRVEGTWNGTPFSFSQDLNEEQELRLDPPLTVVDGEGFTNLTLSLDIGGWFRRSDGSLIDPETASKGEENEGLVELNIRRSIEAFEDDDQDGRRDDD